MNVCAFTDDELATVLVALRMLQADPALPPGVEAITSDDGTKLLTETEIDDLCERINTDGGWDKIEAARVRLHYLLTDPDAADLVDDGDAAQDMVDALNAFTARP